VKDGFIAIFVACGSGGEAKRIAETLLKKRLIACANITGAVRSRFWWKGKIDSAREVLLTLKTARANFAKIEKEVKAKHSYDVPEIIAVPIVAGSREYLEWMNDEIC